MKICTHCVFGRFFSSLVITMLSPFGSQELLRLFYYWVNKTAIFYLFSVPPDPPVIVNEAGREATSQLGPYPEGASAQISCEVGGGKKIPNFFNHDWFFDPPTFFRLCSSKCFFFLFDFEIIWIFCLFLRMKMITKQILSYLIVFAK